MGTNANLRRYYFHSMIWTFVKETEKWKIRSLSLMSQSRHKYNCYFFSLCHRFLSLCKRKAIKNQEWRHNDVITKPIFTNVNTTILTFQSNFTKMWPIVNDIVAIKAVQTDRQTHTHTNKQTKKTRFEGGRVKRSPSLLHKWQRSCTKIKTT